MTRRVSLVLMVMLLACDDPGEPGAAPLELEIIAPAPGETVYELDSVTVLGEAAASDLGLLPDDSIWWTLDGAILGTGRRAGFRATAGPHAIALHARYGPRADSARRELVAAGGGLGRRLWSVTVTPLTLALDESRGVLHTGFAAIRLDGSVLWNRDVGIGGQASGPAVGPDGTVYLGYWIGPTGGDGDDAGGVLALNPDGTRRWVFIAADHGPAGSQYYHAHGGVALDAGGNIYVATEENDSPIYSIRPDGSLRWRGPTLAAGSSQSRFWSYATVLTDSLVGSMRYADSLSAVGAGDGVPRFSLFARNIYCLRAAAVGADGTVYVPHPASPTSGLATMLAAYAPDATPRWDVTLPLHLARGSPVVGRDRIYFAAANGGVLVLALDGGTVATMGPQPVGFFHDGITLGANGVVYATSPEALVSYDAEGNLRFTAPVAAPVGNNCSVSFGGPVIGQDGTVYMTSDSGVVAFRDTVGPATDAPWPTLQGNFQRTGRRAPAQ